MNLAIPQKSPDIAVMLKKLFNKAQEVITKIQTSLVDNILFFWWKKNKGRKIGKGRGRGPFAKNPNGKGPNPPKTRARRPHKRN